MTMPKRSRFRRILKWTCGGMTITLIIAIGLSLLWPVRYRGDTFTFEWSVDGFQYRHSRSVLEFSQEVLQRGRFIERNDREGLDLNAYPPVLYLYPTGFRIVSTVTPHGDLLVLPRWSTARISLPHWLLLATTVMPTAVLFWRDRRRRIPPGHCQRCGYNLTGNVSGKCSECGEVILARQMRTCNGADHADSDDHLEALP